MPGRPLPPVSAVGTSGRPPPPVSAVGTPGRPPPPVSAVGTPGRTRLPAPCPRGTGGAGTRKSGRLGRRGGRRCGGAGAL
eukprot:scaffold15006_cov146-Isochrysis_galbana.AAC.2